MLSKNWSFCFDFRARKGCL